MCCCSPLSCCCCCDCCYGKPRPAPQPQPQRWVVARLGAEDVIISPIFGTVTTQPPPTATQPSAITTQSQVIGSVTSSPPLIIRESRQRIREPLPIARPIHGSASNMAATGALPTAPPAPGATESTPNLPPPDWENTSVHAESTPNLPPPDWENTSVHAEHYWSKTRLSHTEPSVMVGDGFYAGRVLAAGDTLPAILETSEVIDPRSGVVMEQFVAAHFFYKNHAGSTEDFEVLCCSKTRWQPAMGGHVTPENAILCGRAVSGRPLYIGRAFDEGKFHYGTADPEDGLLYSMANAGTWYGCVRTSQHFDILVAA